MSSRALAGFFVCAAALLGPGCGGDAQYDVEIEVVGDVSLVTWVEVAVIERCANLESPADPPPSPLRVVEFSGEASATTIGYLPPGRYGLQGRAWSAGCALLGARCEDVTLEADGDGTLHLLLDPGDGRGCDPGDECVDDRCVLDPGGT